ncbi:MAG TPA: cytochrome c biogenesis protein CcsA [Vicinamibacterales bacterium]|nr:cytochrome c biogenesis protein CcsA [Vicinamibacterales bacterium]
MQRVIVPGLLAVAALMFARAPYLIDAAPYESTMGLVQKIFYFHVPAAMTSMLSAFVCGIASVLYLWRRRPAADHTALAGAELVVVFGVIALVTGPLWARKAWGVWWQWGDARLTITFVMWMIFVAYLLLRRFGGPGSEVMSAAVGLFGMALVPFVYLSVNFWRTIHPTTDVVRSLPPEMAWPFRWSIVAFVLFYAALVLVRVRLERQRLALDEAYAALEE